MMLVRLILITVDVVCVVIDTGRDRYQDWQLRHQQHNILILGLSFNLIFQSAILSRHNESALPFDYAGRIKGSKFKATLKEAKRQLQKFVILFLQV